MYVTGVSPCRMRFRRMILFIFNNTVTKDETVAILPKENCKISHEKGVCIQERKYFGLFQFFQRYVKIWNKRHTFLYRNADHFEYFCIHMLWYENSTFKPA